MADKIQLRRDLAANWTSTNPVLAQGELGVELDTDRAKIGNAVDDWNTLPYVFDGVSDHGALSGLGDNDHPQYALASSLSAVATSGDHSDLNLDDGTNPHGTTKGDVGLANVPNVNATLRGNHTGTQLASTISDFLSAVQASETTTSIALNANVLEFTDEDGVTTSIDLSIYLDDTNLARIVNGSLNGATGIATFTRDDSTTFTVDFSALNDQGAINTAIANHEAALDPHPQYLQSGDLPTNHAEVDAVNNFTESQNITKTSGIASLGINSDDNEATVVFRAGTPENLWAAGADDVTNQFVISSTNGLSASQEFNINAQNNTVNVNTKRIINVVDPTQPQDAATKAYVDANAGGGSLDDLSDVDTSTNAPVANDLLQFDGTNWVPVNTEIGYTYFPIWAEENGGLATGYEWSWGNGSTGAAIGLPLGLDAELFAVSFNAETFGTSITIDSERDGVNVFTASFSTNNTTVNLPTPVAFSSSQRYGFRTNAVSGTFNDARVCGWFRVETSVLSNAILDKLYTPNGLTESLSIQADTSVRLNGYGTGARTGTEAFGIAVSSTGQLIERKIKTIQVENFGDDSFTFNQPTWQTIPGFSLSLTLGETGKITSNFHYSAIRSGGANASVDFRIQIGGVNGRVYSDTLSTFNDIGSVSFARSGLAAGTYSVLVQCQTNQIVLFNAADMEARAIET